MASYNGTTNEENNDQADTANSAPLYHTYAPANVAPQVVFEPITYRLRAYDTTLAAIVYWDSTTLDESEYTGPGPLTNLVLLD
jgi:hypothetical protein